ncbi:IS200/IS605 family transposase [Novipirellula artificiosorum]|nr:IS200/IS605 family transposase [Novipirellula artificiosorum]
MSTYHSLHYHLVFSTKNRKPWIKEAWIGRLHSYLGGTLQGMDVKPLDIGGVEDHVHLLMGMKPTHRISDVVRELKKSATEWVHHEIDFAPFGWQDGYAIFSLSPDACPTVSRYIRHQKEHHQKRSFREELIKMLDRAGIQYDPTYLH